MPQRPPGEFVRDRKLRLNVDDSRCFVEKLWSPLSVSIVSWNVGLLDPSVGILFTRVSNSGSVIGAKSRILVETGLHCAFGTMLPGNGLRTQVLPTRWDVAGS